ncbi:hypothetical protein ACFXKC_20415 [Streptomyces sp. NPDC059340]
MRTAVEERTDREAVIARFADHLSDTDTDADLPRQLLGSEPGSDDR